MTKFERRLSGARFVLYHLLFSLIICGLQVGATNLPLNLNLNNHQNGLFGGGRNDDYDSATTGSLMNYEMGQIPQFFVRPVRRIGSEFLGKRSSVENDEVVDEWERPQPPPPRQSLSGDNVESYYAPYYSSPYFPSGVVDKRSRIRMGSEFLGKRRLGSEFLGKRKRALGSEFLGKRTRFSAASFPYSGSDWSWKRARLGSEFLGKRSRIGSEFLGKKRSDGDIPRL